MILTSNKRANSMLTGRLVMTICGCDAHVPDDLRTCPRCGRELNPNGKDPMVQREQRPGAALASLRLEKIALQKSVEAYEKAAKRAADRDAQFQQSLEDLGAELELLMLEQRQMREGFGDLTERTRLLQARFEALGISTHRPFSASQATMFGPGEEHGDSGAL
jgi:hypothetical protein